MTDLWTFVDKYSVEERARRDARAVAIGFASWWPRRPARDRVLALIAAFPGNVPFAVWPGKHRRRRG